MAKLTIISPGNKKIVHDNFHLRLELDHANSKQKVGVYVNQKKYLEVAIPEQPKGAKKSATTHLTVPIEKVPVKNNSKFTLTAALVDAGKFIAHATILLLYKKEEKNKWVDDIFEEKRGGKGKSEKHTSETETAEFADPWSTSQDDGEAQDGVNNGSDNEGEPNDNFVGEGEEQEQDQNPEQNPDQDPEQGQGQEQEQGDDDEANNQNEREGLSLAMFDNHLGRRKGHKLGLELDEKQETEQEDGRQNASSNDQNEQNDQKKKNKNKDVDKNKNKDTEEPATEHKGHRAVIVTASTKIRHKTEYVIIPDTVDSALTLVLYPLPTDKIVQTSNVVRPLDAVTIVNLSSNVMTIKCSGNDELNIENQKNAEFNLQGNSLIKLVAAGDYWTAV